jgi:hypothetical protein
MIYFWFARKYHKYEFKETRVYLILYTGTFVFFDFCIVVIDWVIYEDIRIFDDDKGKVSDEQRRDTLYEYVHGMNFAMMIDAISWIIIPIILIWFKKNQDMFSCFSKVDDMAKITIFQQRID